jgi:putative membrane protein
VLQWRFATYHLTDKRIVMEGGILSRTAETIPLDRIQNTVIHRPLGDRLIGAGDIEIESAGRDGVEVLHRIPKAESFYNELLATMNAPPASAAPARPPGGV